ncbi:hypothetical protein GWC95_07610 [Sediminibacterium roseum]|uniref:Uncharacterized protein n=1 Tax=Sediminibacterium roseum TaxID=1978412 RepID=A0ABW9ZUR5_9BACT|nr:hypothetical protein [Sediminibacterium roseum]NCI49783.1 hypothetical protein [Sediminibacterium roseum]
MEKRLVNIDPKRAGIAVANYVREQALKTGSFITYKENGKIIRENPRTGEKFVLDSQSAKQK